MSIYMYVLVSIKESINMLCSTIVNLHNQKKKNFVTPYTHVCNSSLLRNKNDLLFIHKIYFMSVICRPTEQEPQGWMGYFGQALKSSATYLPSQMTEMFNQGRAFATARLPNSGMHNVCALAT